MEDITNDNLPTEHEEIFKCGAQIKTMNLKREYIRRVLHWRCSL